MNRAMKNTWIYFLLLVVISSCATTSNVLTTAEGQWVSLRASLPRDYLIYDFTKKEITTLGDTTYAFELVDEGLIVQKHGRKVTEPIQAVEIRTDTLKMHFDNGAIETLIKMEVVAAAATVTKSQIEGDLFRIDEKGTFRDTVTRYLDFMSGEQMVETWVDTAGRHTNVEIFGWHLYSVRGVNLLVLMGSGIHPRYFLKEYKQGKWATLSLRLKPFKIEPSVETYVETYEARPAMLVTENIKSALDREKLFGDWEVTKCDKPYRQEISRITFSENQIMIDGGSAGRKGVWGIDKFGNIMKTSLEGNLRTIYMGELKGDTLVIHVQDLTYTLSKK